MSTVVIPDDPAVIEPTLSALKKGFASHKTKILAFRKQQLQNLVRGIQELEQEFHDALKLDMGASKLHSQLFSTVISLNDIRYTLANFESWAKPRKTDATLLIGPANTYILPEPFGVVLVIAAWNYPLYTALPPAAQAIAAGNCVVVKPSEMAPYSSKVIKKLFEKYLDPACYQVIEGASKVASTICNHPFDLIIFTGSPQKGKLVAQAAANNLIPCILELGGKSPTVVDKNLDMDNAILRIAQGRFLNSGQTCVACDYILAHKSVATEFVSRLKDTLDNFYNKDASKSKDWIQIINTDHTKRLKSMLDENHGGKVVYGGDINVETRYIGPTIVLNPNLNSKMMTEEIFGPILPVILWEKIEEVIDFINARPKPLALYYFGDDSKHRKLLEEKTSSGAFSVNEACFHVANPHQHFGGVGNSGYGAYHGKHGFESCSHMKPVFSKAKINMFPFSTRFPPYTPTKEKTILTLFNTMDVDQAKVLRALKFLTVVITLAVLKNKGKLDPALALLKGYFNQVMSNNSKL